MSSSTVPFIVTASPGPLLRGIHCMMMSNDALNLAIRLKNRFSHS